MSIEKTDILLTVAVQGLDRMKIRLQIRHAQEILNLKLNQKLLKLHH